MNPQTEYDSLERLAPCAGRPQPCGGFTLIELMIVTVILGLLAGMALPQFDDIRQRAYNAATLADLDNASNEIERFFAEHYRYPTTDSELFAEGYSHTPGVSFTRFQIRDSGKPTARIHIHIEHEGSSRYYHFEYPGSAVPEIRWK